MSNEIELSLWVFILAIPLGSGIGAPRFAAAAHAADVADQRDLGHLRGGRDPGRRRRARAHAEPRPGLHCGHCSTINIVSGFLITDRMLKMFRKKEPQAGGRA